MADRGEIRVGAEYQAPEPADRRPLRPGQPDPERPQPPETLLWTPGRIADAEVDTFLKLARWVDVDVDVDVDVFLWGMYFSGRYFSMKTGIRSGSSDSLAHSQREYIRWKAILGAPSASSQSSLIDLPSIILPPLTAGPFITCHSFANLHHPYLINPCVMFCRLLLPPFTSYLGPITPFCLFPV